MKNRSPAFAATLLLTACGATVTTRTESPSHALAATLASPDESAQAPKLTSDPATQLATLAAAAKDDPAALDSAAHFALRAGAKIRARNPAAAVGFFINSIELALRSAAERRPVPADSRYDTANAALLQLITLGDKPQDPRRTVATPLGPRTVDVESVFTNDPTQPAFDRLEPADLISLTGFTHRVVIPGFGVPLVGIRKNPNIPYYENRGTFTPVTAVPRLGRLAENANLTIQLLNPRESVNVDAPGGPTTLAADYTAPIALVFDGLNDLALGIRGLLFVGDQMKLAGLYMLEPYDPDRIPVLMVHGLGSSPLIWRNLINELQIDPVIRENYQFWVVYYPSGVSTVNSAAFLRKQIAGIRETFDPDGDDLATRDLVTVGHSMGGVITRMNEVQIGNRLWQAISDRPFESLPLDPPDEALLRDRLFWEPIPAAHTAIFFSSPHRGATLADTSLANFAARLIRFPTDILRAQTRLLTTLASFLVLDFDVSDLTNSVGSLSPNNPVFRAVNSAPFKPDLKYYTVVGDRGKGDTPDSSDGIVGYWSSHLEGATRELIVPTGHESFTHPKSVAFTHEILRDHLSE